MAQKHAVRTHRLSRTPSLSLAKIAVFWFPEHSQRFCSERHSCSWGAGLPDFKVDVVATSPTYVRCVYVCLCVCLDPLGAIVR